MIVLTIFLYSDICEMNFGLMDFGFIISGMGKSCKAIPVEIDRQRTIRSNKNINSDVKFFTSYQKWVIHVSLNYVGL